MSDELHYSEEKKMGNMGHLSSRKLAVVNVGAYRTKKIMEAKFDPKNGAIFGHSGARHSSK